MDFCFCPLLLQARYKNIEMQWVHMYVSKSVKEKKQLEVESLGERYMHFDKIYHISYKGGCTPISTVRKRPFPCSSVNIVCYWAFSSLLNYRGKVLVQCSFVFTFLVKSNVEHLFRYSLSFVFSFLLSIPLFIFQVHFFYWGVVLFLSDL